MRQKDIYDKIITATSYNDEFVFAIYYEHAKFNGPIPTLKSLLFGEKIKIYANTKEEKEIFATLCACSVLNHNFKIEFTENQTYDSYTCKILQKNTFQDLINSKYLVIIIIIFLLIFFWIIYQR